jgi:hypothetical protein
MSIRIRVSCGRKISTTKGNGTPTFGSYVAGTSIAFSLEDELLKTPEAFVARIREMRAIARASMYDELAVLKVEANGQAALPAPAAAPPPSTPPPAARTPAVTADRRRPSPAEVAASMKDYVPAQEFNEYGEPDGNQEQEDEDPPADGKHLLGWARNQPGDAKGFLIGLGKKLHFPNKILDWTPKQVDIGYQAAKKLRRNR